MTQIDADNTKARKAMLKAARRSFGKKTLALFVSEFICVIGVHLRQAFQL
jgi:hypothetical protein